LNVTKSQPQAAKYRCSGQFKNWLESQAAPGVVLNPEDEFNIIDRFPGGLLEFYGLTEGGFFCMFVGRSGYPGELWA
jgi:hypothetical protein